MWQTIIDFLKDYWIPVSGGVIALVTLIAVPALRSVAKKALIGALKAIVQAIISSITEEAIIKVVINTLEKLAKSTENTLDDSMVEAIKKRLDEKPTEQPNK